jgi:hypothetical protein
LTEPVPALVTLHLWRVPRGKVAHAVARMAVDRGRARRTPGVRFAKMLGTGDGRTFTVRDADPTRWAMLSTWATTTADSPVARSWEALAAETYRLDLRPLVSRGRWSGREPFGAPEPRKVAGPVAAITRARLSTRKARSFWSAVPPVSAVLQRSPGVLAAVGIGEAPVGLQGTFSLWSSADALRDFAHREAAHTDVIARTQTEGWYAEELFARFEVLGSEGTLDGRDPLA